MTPFRPLKTYKVAGYAQMTTLYTVEPSINTNGTTNMGVFCVQELVLCLGALEMAVMWFPCACKF